MKATFKRKGVIYIYEYSCIGIEKVT